jgi:hypothetical protein
MQTLEDYERRKSEDQAKEQKARLDLAEVVNQYDTLAQKIVADLAQAESDLGTLRGIEDLVFKQGKQSSQYFDSFINTHVTGNITTTKMLIENARKSIVTKG